MPIRWPVLFFVPVLCLKAQCGAEDTFSQINALLQNHKYEEATHALDKLRPCTALSPINRFQMGWFYGRARNFAAALSAFNAVPENVPDISTHKYAVALTKFELADYRGAADVLKSLSSQSQFDSKSANLLAVSYSKLGLLQNAYLVLVQDIHDYPQDLSAYLNLITLCADGGNFTKAASVASEASRLFPQSSEVFVVLGAANTLLGHLDEAQKNFTTAADLAPQTAEPRFFTALTKYKLGDYPAAVNVLKSAIAADIADPDLHYLLAECLLKLDPVDRAAAMAQLNRAIELNSNSISARTLRGKLLLESNHLSEAVTDLEVANHLDPTSRSAAYNLARAFRAQGKIAEAESLFKSLRAETTNTLTEFSDKRLNEALQQPSTRDTP